MNRTSHRHKAPSIELMDLEVSYGGRVVLSDIRAVVPSGVVTVILGGSGGGKSTLLKAILGLLRPTAGKVLIGGQDIYALDQEAMRQTRKSMGVLFQDGALLGSIPLCENIALPMREHTVFDEQMIETLVAMKLSLVGLEGFMDFFPNQLSGGMRKRAGLARALALDPRILLCDEPTSGLDPITAADLDQLILDLKAAFGMTIVVVTHDLASVFAIADHVIVLNKGRVVYQGDQDGLKASQDAFLRQFLARLPSRGRRQGQEQGNGVVPT